jgi:hypothetical protein
MVRTPRKRGRPIAAKPKKVNKTEAPRLPGSGSSRPDTSIPVTVAQTSDVRPPGSSGQIEANSDYEDDFDFDLGAQAPLRHRATPENNGDLMDTLEAASSDDPQKAVFCKTKFDKEGIFFGGCVFLRSKATYSRKTKTKDREQTGHVWLCTKLTSSFHCLGRIHVSLDNIITESADDIEHNHMFNPIEDKCNEV